MRNIHIIMPLGGLGSRFSSKGYVDPKPLIDVDGQPMFMKALSCFDKLDCEKKYTFIVRYDHVEKFSIIDRIKEHVPNANFSILMENTRGAVETCLKAKDFIRDDEAVVILDCDLEFYSASYFKDIEEDLKNELPFIGGCLISFNSSDPRYSYAQVDENMNVIRTAEKNPISTHALAGSYYFSFKRSFIDAAEALIADFDSNRIKTKELYLSLLYNYVIKSGLAVKLHKLEKYNSFGTPDELDDYIKRKHISLEGHSGCEIEFIDGRIRKSTCNRSYIERLSAQIKKQKAYKKFIESSITYFNVPDIFNCNESELCYSADMEYIDGKSFIDFFENCDDIAVSNFIDETINLINFELQQTKNEDVGEKLKKKYESVKTVVRNNKFISDDEEIIKLVDSFESLFDDSECIVPIGFSHGDMTLSNMIFKDNEVFLIDFLDSFIETPFMDIVKLRQDTKYNWSYLLVKNDKVQSNFERSKFILYKIDREIENYFNNGLFKSSYMKLQVMNFLRILQYAKKPHIIQYLKFILNDFAKEVK